MSSPGPLGVSGSQSSPGPLTALRVAALLGRPRGTGAGAVMLPLVAFAVVTALVLVTTGGALALWTWDGPDPDALQPTYQGLTAIAVVLLVVPLATLGGSAARLSARRRDDRLATLRLLGGTGSLVRAVTVAESAVVALAGALLGVLLAGALLPVAGLLRFHGEAMGAARLWPGVGAVAGVVAGVVLLAVVSGVVGLQRVVVSPLGVRARQTPPRQRWWRLAVAALLLASWSTVWQRASTSLQSAMELVAVVVVGLGVALAVLNLAGPVVLALAARVSLRRAGTPERLLAARAVLDAPKAAWRQVSGVAMTTFVAVVTGVGLALVGSADDGRSSTAELELGADVQTGVLVTLVASFLVVACSVGVNQAAAVLDRRDLWVGLDRAGMPRATMDKARSRAVLAPLRQVTALSAGAGAVLVAPLVGVALLFAPLALLVIAGCLVGGVGLVVLALHATRPVLSAVLAAPERV